MNDLKLILTSINNPETAQVMAKALVLQKLAACVQISSAGTSVYQWKGDICTDKEFYLQVKTDVSHVQAVVSWLETNHPYDTPEITILNAKASVEYQHWLKDCLK